MAQLTCVLCGLIAEYRRVSRQGVCICEGCVNDVLVPWVLTHSFPRPTTEYWSIDPHIIWYQRTTLTCSLCVLYEDTYYVSFNFHWPSQSVHHPDGLNWECQGSLADMDQFLHKKKTSIWYDPYADRLEAHLRIRLVSSYLLRPLSGMVNEYCLGVTAR